MPFDINANLLALTSKGNIKFVRLFDLNTLESNKSKLLEGLFICCLLYTSPSPRDGRISRMPSSA